MRIGLSAGVLVLVVFAARFWVHDVLPYLIDYSEESYSRYWRLRIALLPHILGGSIALFAGPLQLWSGLRNRFRRLHRLVGYAYMTGVALSASSSFYLAFYARPDFGLSLFVLAVMWCVSIAMALTAIRNGRIDAHREWTIRSYIITFAFVSYRFLVDVSIFRGLDEGRFASVLWLSWVIPMMLFEVFTQRNRVTPLKRPVRPAASREVV